VIHVKTTESHRNDATVAKVFWVVTPCRIVAGYHNFRNP